MIVMTGGKEYDLTSVEEAIEYGLDLVRFTDGMNAAKNMAEVRDSPLTAQFEQANALLAEMRGQEVKWFGGTDD